MTQIQQVDLSDVHPTQFWSDNNVVSFNGFNNDVFYESSEEDNETSLKNMPLSITEIRQCIKSSPLGTKMNVPLDVLQKIAEY